jgi:hypothetical protein
MKSVQERKFNIFQVVRLTSCRRVQVLGCCSRLTHGFSTAPPEIGTQHIHRPMHPFHWSSRERSVRWISRLARRRTLETEPLQTTSRETLAGVRVSIRRCWLKGEIHVFGLRWPTESEARRTGAAWCCFSGRTSRKRPSGGSLMKERPDSGIGACWKRRTPDRSHQEQTVGHCEPDDFRPRDEPIVSTRGDVARRR